MVATKTNLLLDSEHSLDTSKIPKANTWISIRDVAPNGLDKVDYEKVDDPETFTEAQGKDLERSRKVVELHQPDHGSADDIPPAKLGDTLEVINYFLGFRRAGQSVRRGAVLDAAITNFLDDLHYYVFPSANEFGERVWESPEVYAVIPKTMYNSKNSGPTETMRILEKIGFLAEHYQIRSFLFEDADLGIVWLGDKLDHPQIVGGAASIQGDLKGDPFAKYLANIGDLRLTLDSDGRLAGKLSRSKSPFFDGEEIADQVELTLPTLVAEFDGNLEEKQVAYPRSKTPIAQYTPAEESNKLSTNTAPAIRTAHRMPLLRAEPENVREPNDVTFLIPEEIVQRDLVDPDTIADMTNNLSYRAPDGIGIDVESGQEAEARRSNGAKLAQETRPNNTRRYGKIAGATFSRV